MLQPLESLLSEPRILAPGSTAHPDINSVAGLVEMMRALPPVALLIEVGSYAGVSTEVFCHFSRRVLAVDPWQGLDRAKRDFDARFGDCGQVSYLRLPSLEAALLVGDGVADLVYLDADHREVAVAADILAWRPKVRGGGWLAGHDYTERVESGGVIRAVDRLLGKPHAVYSDTSWIVRL